MHVTLHGRIKCEPLYGLPVQTPCRGSVHSGNLGSKGHTISTMLLSPGMQRSKLLGGPRSTWGLIFMARK